MESSRCTHSVLSVMKTFSIPMMFGSFLSAMRSCHDGLTHMIDGSKYLDFTEIELQFLLNAPFSLPSIDPIFQLSHLNSRIYVFRSGGLLGVTKSVDPPGHELPEIDHFASDLHSCLLFNSHEDLAESSCTKQSICDHIFVPELLKWSASDLTGIEDHTAISHSWVKSNANLSCNFGIPVKTREV